MRQWQSFDGAMALVDDEQPGQGLVVVTWVDTGDRCDGWVAGDHLFLPFDGQSPVGANVDEAGMPEGAWYEAASGAQAIVGLPSGPVLLV